MQFHLQAVQVSLRIIIDKLANEPMRVSFVFNIKIWNTGHRLLKLACQIRAFLVTFVALDKSNPPEAIKFQLI